MAFTEYLAAAIATVIFKDGTLTSPGDNLFVGLSESADPTDELSGGSYSRVQVEADDWTQTDNVVVNAEPVAFPQATAAWSTISHWVVFDASTSGNALYVGQLVDSGGDPTTREVDEDDILTFAPGELVITHETE